jgi:hypothetical protein
MYKALKANNPGELVEGRRQPLDGAKRPECSGKIDDDVCTIRGLGGGLSQPETARTASISARVLGQWWRRQTAGSSSLRSWE